MDISQKGGLSLPLPGSENYVTELFWSRRVLRSGCESRKNRDVLGVTTGSIERDGT